MVFGCLKKASYASLLCCFLLHTHATGQTPVKPLLGFSPERSTKQRALEQRFDALLSPSNLREWMKRLSARPHHLGSPYDKENAEYIAAQFRSWGYDTQIETFEVLFSTPKSRLLELVAPNRFRAKLQEPILKEDSTSGVATAEQLPTYNVYSADGDVTGDLVYVNYGVPKDYELLAERGIDVRGKIVIARYGGSWRGIKPKVAAEHGAVGCLIYSDPRDDGYFQGDVYPKGAYRNPQGAQRGSVADAPLYSGDPLTPGVGATKDAKRLSRSEAPSLAKIPVLPISYADAEPLLRAMAGPVAPEEWRGALPFTYHLGPGPAKVHLALSFNWKMVTLYDVIARISGAERPDQWVIRGNHHDAWVFGAQDPLSGAVALMEEARAVSELVKGGWKPKRTLVYTVWDGEEQGLLGSTEWVETHADLLTKNAVLYVNSDGNGRGFLNAGGSHTLETLVNEAARDVKDPQTGLSVWERWRAVRLVRGTAEERKEARDRADLRIAALGSGSDYTPFLQHLGIPSLNLGFGGEGGGGSYHSIFDSFDWYIRFGDPDFRYGIALAQTAGRIVLRAADADILPYRFTGLADSIGQYVDEIARMTGTMREQTRERNRLITDGTLAATFDPRQTNVLPKPLPEVPALDFTPLQNAVKRLRTAAEQYDARIGDFVSDSGGQKNRDALLLPAEREMLAKNGLPRRPWYKHQIYAPGFYTGYSVKTLPGVREAVEERKWEEAREQILLAAAMLETIAARLERAAVR